MSLSFPVNRVRCHLQIFSLADIATGDGLRIQNKFLQGRNESKESIWDWPLEQSSPRDFNEWRSAVSLLINERSLLKYPVGRWLAQPHSKIDWLYSPE